MVNAIFILVIVFMVLPLSLAYILFKKYKEIKLLKETDPTAYELLLKKEVHSPEDKAHFEEMRLGELGLGPRFWLKDL